MPVTQSRAKAIEPMYELGNLALMSNAIEHEAGRQVHDQALMIASALQATLDLDKLIEIFSLEVKTLLPHSGITFTYEEDGQEISHGKAGRHRCSYRLVVAEQALGQLTISRNRPFKQNESMLLEYLLCGLVYPLRNAIMYKHALTAALRDPLTGVNNRSAMNAAMVRETELARRHKTPLSVIMMDIDFFKQVNDRYGHLAGDFVLRSVADAVSNCTRCSDIIFRSGGEEFLIVLSNTDQKGAMHLAERIRKTLAGHDYHYGDHHILVTASFGVACFREGENSDALLEKADRALYDAKADGRNCVRFSAGQS